MKILVHGASLAAAPRMSMAAAGLALRGHEVAWSGPAPDAVLSGTPVRRVLGGLAHARAHVDLVLGGPGMPFRTAAAGRLARAHGMVLTTSSEAVRAWTAIDRLGWDSIYSFALVEAADADVARGAIDEDMLQRMALWSDAAPSATPDAAAIDTEILERTCERTLARHRMSSARAAVFLDRDGTLIVEREYLADPEQVELLPGVPEALRALRAAGYALVVVSNQSGVGRGYFSMARVYEVMARLRIMLRRHQIELDAIYFCPHRPDENCACRKPGVRLLERAIDDLQLTPSRSAMVGDKLLDVETGQGAGTLGVLVRSGYGAAQAEVAAAGGGVKPDHVADDMRQAARWIVEKGEALPA